MYFTVKGVLNYKLFKNLLNKLNIDLYLIHIEDKC